MIGRYSFDNDQLIDSSGNRNHGFGQVIPGPGWAGGISGVFRQNWVYVPGLQFPSGDMSLTFKVFRLTAADKKETVGYCPIIIKGVVEGGGGQAGQSPLKTSPGIFIDPNGRLKVSFTTGGEDTEYLISNSRLREERWYQVTLIRHSPRVRLYIDGILDSSIKIENSATLNRYPLYIGGSPWTAGECDIPILLDDLEVYDVALGRDQIQAQAAALSPLPSPSSMILSCVGCTQLQAEEGCPVGYHLCSKTELSFGPYSAIRKLGLDGPVLTSEDTATGLVGIGVCCFDVV